MALAVGGGGRETSRGKRSEDLRHKDPGYHACRERYPRSSQRAAGTGNFLPGHKMTARAAGCDHHLSLSQLQTPAAPPPMLKAHTKSLPRKLSMLSRVRREDSYAAPERSTCSKKPVGARGLNVAAASSPFLRPEDSPFLLLPLL